MAVTVLVADVKELLSVSSDISDADITSIIVTANILVERIAVADSTVPAATLTDIERWLAAHFVDVARQRQGKSEAIDGSSQSIGGQYGKGLDFTPYGQMAILLDTTDTLANLSVTASAATLDVD